MAPNWKPCGAARKLKQKADRQAVKAQEAGNKRQAIIRDRGCRFPRCGCKKAGLAIHGSHVEHKGAGGDKLGIRSDVDNLMGLCVHRHQDGAVSIHRGTLRPVMLTSDKTNGPVRWDVDLDALGGGLDLPWHTHDGSEARWVTIACERSRGVLLPLELWQEAVLMSLSRMER